MKQFVKREFHSRSKFFACLLTFCAGFIDAYTFIERGGTLVAGQTGNVVFLSVELINQETRGIEVKLATMLAFITCDANISSATLQAALSQHVETTFNQITVDGDTSTNDMVLVMANGCRQNEEILPNTEEFEKFSKMLRYLMADLAKKIAKDGEGATKLIEVNVRHAKDERSGRMIAKSVVGSSLVKTAIFGQDPNWGRILAAIGYAGADVSVDNIDIWIEGIPVMQASTPVTFNPEETSDAMAGELLTLTIDLHDGDAEAQAWGCDLSYDYVKINALYRT